MKICDLTTPIIRLQQSTKKLREAWLASEPHWNDRSRMEFEKKYLEPLLPNVALTVSAVGRIAKLLEQAERDLEDNGR